MRNVSVNLEFYLEKIHYKENKKLNNGKGICVTFDLRIINRKKWAKEFEQAVYRSITIKLERIDDRSLLELSVLRDRGFSLQHLAK